MKPEVQHATGVIDVTVTPEMTARLDGKEVHPVYSTFWLAYHAEVAARRAIEPFFDEEEDAVGGALTLQHRAMAAVGAEIRVTAEVTTVDGRYITCSVKAHILKTRTLLAEGTQLQVVMSRADIATKIRNASH